MTDRPDRADRPIRAALLTVSDRCSRGQAEDTSGPALGEMIRQRLNGEIVGVICVPDEVEQIAEQLKSWAHHVPRLDLILTTGGTGLAPRDVTPEATRGVLDRRHSGLMELIRLRCYAKTPRAFLSRGEAGTIAQTLVVNLPGSRRGATENFQALLDILPHAIQTLRGEVQDDGRPDATPIHGKVIHHEEGG